MKDHTQRAVAYIVGRLATGKYSSSLHDFSVSKDFTFEGSVSPATVSIFDYQKRCKITGSGDSGSFTLLHHGNYRELILNFEAEKNRFSGYDEDSKTNYSGTVDGGSISVYDYEHSKLFTYSLYIMGRDQLNFTYIGGPTALLEFSGLRLLTDPTFDPAGEEYPTPWYTLRKTAAPALSSESLGRIDAVLLSHDHHFDNLDHRGRAFLKNAGMVLTTQAGAKRLGGHAVGLAPWQGVDLPTPDGRVLRVTGTPARHGPVDGDRGPVIGFVLALTESPERAIYISGDTVWYEGVAEVSQCFSVRIAILFMGAARVLEVGTAHLTFTAEGAVEAARVFVDAAIIPLHYEGWMHFSESRKEIEDAFISAGLERRLQWTEPGRANAITI